MKKLLWLIILLFSLDAFSQYSFDWTQLYGKDTLFEIRNISLSPNRNIFISGIIHSVFTHSFLMKIGSNGKIQWFKTFNYYPTVVPNALCFTPDSEIVIAGYTSPIDSVTTTLWLAKYNHNGSLLWQKTFPQFGNSSATDIKCTDKKIFITGFTSPTFYTPEKWLILTLDSTGNIIWYKTLGNKKAPNHPSSIAIYRNFIAVSGYFGQKSPPNKFMTLTLLSTDGSLIWKKTLFQFNNSQFSSVTFTPDSNILAVGYFQNSFNLHNIYVCKISTNNSLIWAKTLPMPYDAIPFDLTSNPDSSYSIAYLLWATNQSYSQVGIITLDSLGKIKSLQNFYNISDNFSAKIIHLNNNQPALLATMYVGAIGWVLTLFKPQTSKPKLSVLNLNNKLTKTTFSPLTLHICLQDNFAPKYAVIYINKHPVDTISNFYLNVAPQCPFSIVPKIKLAPGFNKITIKINDYKNNKLLVTHKILYIPWSKK